MLRDYKDPARVIWGSGSFEDSLCPGARGGTAASGASGLKLQDSGGTPRSTERRSTSLSSPLGLRSRWEWSGQLRPT